MTDRYKPLLEHQKISTKELVGAFLWRSQDGKYWRIESIENGECLLREITTEEYAFEVNPMMAIMAKQMNVIYSEEDSEGTPPMQQQQQNTAPLDQEPRRYPRSLIFLFVSSQRNLIQGQSLSAWDVNVHPFFSGLKHFPGGHIDLLYELRESDPPQPALAFRKLPPQQGDKESEMYHLLWIDPSLEPLWDHDVLSHFEGQHTQD